MSVPTSLDPPTPVGQSSLVALACLAVSLAMAVAYLVIGQAVWDPWTLAVLVAVGIIIGGGDWLGRSPESRARAMPVVFGRGVVLGVWWFLVGIGSWNVGDLVAGGKLAPSGRWLLALALGCLAGIVTAWFVLATAKAWIIWGRRVVLALAALAAMMAIALYLAYTGAADPARYLPRAQSPYKLPWPAGVTWLCSQGNWGVISHRNGDEYAYDFAMPIGNDICAARDGVVIGVVDQNDGNGWRQTPGNIVTVRHDDHSYALYVHVRQHGSFVRFGDRVKQSQVIASSGNVGFSTAPHLHFEVRDAMWRSVPITFADVETGQGIPRMFLRYTSGNKPSN